jgi:hypothetical protein
MEQKELVELVRRLHSELEEIEPLDGESRQLLKDLLLDIRQALTRSPEADTAADASLRERLGLAIRRFELAHPVLTSNLARVVEGLREIGI